MTSVANIPDQGEDPFHRNLKRKILSFDSSNLFEVSIMEFHDKIIIQLTNNGEMDFTYDIQFPSSNQLSRSITFESNIEGNINTVCLVGDANNMKLMVMCSQIGKLFASFECFKNIILTTSSKLWKPNDDDGDFEKLMVILDLIKQTYHS